MDQPALLVAPLTPFDADLRLDERALRRQIDYVVADCRASMVVAAGVETQEYTYLGLEARKALIRRTIELVDRRVPVMVGVSHPSFRAAVELAQEAERLGAAAIQLLAPLRPFAGAPTQGDLIAYFEAVARETMLPITLYLNPGPGAELSIADTIALARLARVHFIKESSRDLARVSRLIVEIDRAGHARYFTTMQMLLITLQLGGSGATMPPPAAEIAAHLIDAVLARDYERAAAIQLQFALFPGKWMHRGLAPVMKAAMKLIGVPAGEPYPPYQPLSAEESAAMAAVLSTSVLAPRLVASANSALSGAPSCPASCRAATPSGSQ
jgi:4-hydroxy-tetrahydrodipicolinate synthase